MPDYNESIANLLQSRSLAQQGALARAGLGLEAGRLQLSQQAQQLEQQKFSEEQKNMALQRQLVGQQVAQAGLTTSKAAKQLWMENNAPNPQVGVQPAQDDYQKALDEYTKNKAQYDQFGQVSAGRSPEVSQSIMSAFGAPPEPPVAPPSAQDLNTIHPAAWDNDTRQRVMDEYISRAKTAGHNVTPGEAYQSLENQFYAQNPFFNYEVAASQGLIVTGYDANGRPQFTRPLGSGVLPLEKGADVALSTGREMTGTNQAKDYADALQFYTQAQNSYQLASRGNKDADKALVRAVTYIANPSLKQKPNVSDDELQSYVTRSIFGDAFAHFRKAITGTALSDADRQALLQIANQNLGSMQAAAQREGERVSTTARRLGVPGSMLPQFNLPENVTRPGIPPSGGSSPITSPSGRDTEYPGSAGGQGSGGNLKRYPTPAAAEAAEQPGTIVLTVNPATGQLQRYQVAGSGTRIGPQGPRGRGPAPSRQ